MTYKQAYDKIIEAYFKDEIKPMKPEFCFCGTLCDNTDRWYGNMTLGYHFPFNGYEGSHFVEMERALLNHVRFIYNKADYEDALFAGMSAALDVLKQIHIDRGEIIDEIPEFTKRNICAPKN